jgi:hypothetical protein
MNAAGCRISIFFGRRGFYFTTLFSVLQLAMHPLRGKITLLPHLPIFYAECGSLDRRKEKTPSFTASKKLEHVPFQFQLGYSPAAIFQWSSLWILASPKNKNFYKTHCAALSPGKAP